LSLGLLVIEAEGVIFLSNRRAAEILGYEGAALEGKGWAELFFAANPYLDFNTDFNQTLVDVIYRKEVHLQRRVWYRSPSGEARYLCVTASFLREGAEFAGIVVLIDDQTELFQLHQREKQNLERQRHLQEERSEGLDQLARAVAHQVRNPVVAIGGFAARLKRDYPPQSAGRQYLRHIMDGAARLERMVQAVSDYTALTRAKLERCHCRDLLTAVRARLDAEAAERGLGLAWEESIEADWIEADPQLMRCALEELVRNALDFARRDPARVHILLERDAAGWVLVVRDDGPGISAKALPFVFDPFYTTKAVGVGMGLTKVRRVAIEHGGEVKVSNLVGQGTEVRLRRPGPNPAD